MCENEVPKKRRGVSPEIKGSFSVGMFSLLL